MSKVNFSISIEKEEEEMFYLFDLVNLSKDLLNLISMKNHEEIALMINRRTLNNNELLDRLIEQYDFQIPGRSTKFSFIENVFFLIFVFR